MLSMLSMLSADTEMERDLQVERTQTELARAKVQRKTLGRASKTAPAERSEIWRGGAAGETASAMARAYGVSRVNIIGIRDSHSNR